MYRSRDFYVWCWTRTHRIRHRVKKLVYDLKWHLLCGLLDHRRLFYIQNDLLLVYTESSTDPGSIVAGN